MWSLLRFLFFLVSIFVALWGCLALTFLTDPIEISPSLRSTNGSSTYTNRSGVVYAINATFPGHSSSVSPTEIPTPNTTAALDECSYVNCSVSISPPSALPPVSLRSSYPFKNGCGCTEPEKEWFQRDGLKAARGAFAAIPPHAANRSKLGVIFTSISDDNNAGELMASADTWNNHICGVMPYDVLIMHESVSDTMQERIRRQLGRCTAVIFFRIAPAKPPPDVGDTISYQRMNQILGCEVYFQPPLFNYKYYLRVDSDAGIKCVKMECVLCMYACK
jgi:hypothetical protein